MIPLLLLPFFLTVPLFSEAQHVQVTITVKNSRNDGVPSATVSLADRLDSTKNYTGLTDAAGKARFSNLPNAQYIIRITAINYQPLEKGITVNAGEADLSFTLENAGRTMEEVVVQSRRPLMRQEDDKTIVDPENLVAASTSGYEVIEKTPGLFVDQDGNIYISSLTPAAIQINGREMKMSPADVATLLKSLPPAAIARIEIVRSPSAKYDASGGGGVVNIVLKKGVRLGMTGSVNTGMQQGTYGNQFAGFNLNNNTGKRTSFINLNISRRNSFERIRTDRIFAPDSMLSQDAYTRYPALTYFGGYGMAWEPNKNWEFDYSGSISLNDFNNKTNNPTSIRKISTNEAIRIDNRVQNDGYSLNLRNGFSFTRKFDSLGSGWKNDIFHNYTRNESEQFYSSWDPDVPSLQLAGGDGTGDNHRHYLAFTSDLVMKLKNKFTLEAGLKSGIMRFRSRTEYFTQTASGPRDEDPGRTNSFNYDETINSAYLQGTKTLAKDLVLKFGTRLENTNMKGHQLVPGDTSFNLHRTDLFPYIYLSKNVMKIFGYNLRAFLIYRRTISRPVYEQLNPFPRYVDQFLSEAGNPSLRPQFTQNYEANISVDERPILAVGVNDTKDIFTSVIYASDTNSSYSYRTYDNIGKNREWYLRGLGAIPPGGKYFIVVGAQYNHNFYQGLYENKPLAFKKGTWTFFMYQTLKLGKLSQLTVNGFLRLKGQQQFYELSSFGALNASVNRQLFKQKLVLTLSMSDIFYSHGFKFNIEQGSVKASGERLNDTRRFGINLRYNFGIRKKEEPAPDFNSIPVN